MTQQVIRALLVASLLVFASCGANGAAQGDGTGNAGMGHVKVGVPF